MATPNELRAAARGLVPAIRAAREASERERRLAPEVVAAMHAAQLFRMYIPRALGGLEVDPITAMEVVETVAAADGAAGWTLMIGSTYGIWASMLPEATARQIYAAPDAVVAGALRPSGRARIVDGGYVVTGRWSFASGISHAQWWNAGCQVYDGDTLRRDANGEVDVRVVFFPAARGRLIENWDVGGLRGTGSHDYAVEELFVPHSHVITNAEPPRDPAPLYRLPLYALLDNTMAVVPLGIARTAINTLVELAQDKRSAGFAARPAERASVQAEVGRAEALLRSARAWLYASVAESWEQAKAGHRFMPQDTAMLRLARIHCAAAAAQAVDLVHSAAGGSALYTRSLIERCFRDVHAVTQHVSMHGTNYEVCGRVLLGQPPDRPRL